jgi:hypothetical protein
MYGTTSGVYEREIRKYGTSRIYHFDFISIPTRMQVKICNIKEIRPVSIRYAEMKL